MKNITAAVIGTGFIGPAHVEALKRTPGVLFYNATDPASSSGGGVDADPPKPMQGRVPAGGDLASKSKPSEPRTPQTADNLPVIEGLDTQDGLFRVAENRTLYLKLLRQFVEQQGLALDQISAGLAGGEHGLAERLAHTLKGVAGNIGAKGVQVAAGPLEKLIRDKALPLEVDAAMKRVAAVLDPLVAQLRTTFNAVLSETPLHTTAAPTDPAKVREAAARLTSRCFRNLTPARWTLSRHTGRCYGRCSQVRPGTSSKYSSRAMLSLMHKPSSSLPLRTFYHREGVLPPCVGSIPPVSTISN